MQRTEQVSLFDSDGRAIGAAPRDEAYAQSLCVGLVFVWAAWADPSGRGQLLLQTRARPDDPYAGSLDAAAGGHIRAGEPPEQAAHREFTEEVGIALRDEELLYLGHMELQDTRGDALRRAMQFFYMCTRPIDLREPIFNEEVDAFALVALDDFSRLVSGQVTVIEGSVRRASAPDSTDFITVTPRAFAAYSAPIMDAIGRSARALQHALAHGRADLSIWR